MDRELKAKVLEVADEIFQAGQRSVVESFADKLGVVGGKKRGRKPGRKRGKRTGPTLKTKITALLRRNGKPMTAPEIVAGVGGVKASVSSALFQMKTGKQIKQPKRGLWTV